MPVHDWTRVDAGIFHHFHHEWISTISNSLNAGLLPPDYYALAEQQAAGFGPDVLTLQGLQGNAADTSDGGPAAGKGNLLVAEPKVQFTAESEREYYRRKRSTITVRHISGDRIVAMVEVVSPGNKASRNALRAFVGKAAELLEKRVHLLILDLHPPGRRDPHGIHAAIWEEVSGEESESPAARPLTLAAYESGPRLRAFVSTVAVGDVLPEMPLFLEPGAHILVPLEATYQAAFAAVPRRWQRVLEAGPS
jgi:hypothetical protein